MENIRDSISKSRGRQKRCIHCLLLALFCYTSSGSADEKLLSSPNHRLTVIAKNDIQIADNEARTMLSLGPAQGASNIRTFWAPQSNKVLLSTKNRNGFTLFAAQLQNRRLQKLSVPDPGDELYRLIERTLGIKIGNGPAAYRVYAEELLEFTWTGSSATAHEMWSLAENLGEGKKMFKFQVTYTFGADGVKIAGIQPGE